MCKRSRKLTNYKVGDEMDGMKEKKVAMKGGGGGEEGYLFLYLLSFSRPPPLVVIWAHSTPHTPEKARLQRSPCNPHLLPSPDVHQHRRLP